MSGAGPVAPADARAAGHHGGDPRVVQVVGDREDAVAVAVVPREGPAPPHTEPSAFCGLVVLELDRVEPRLVDEVRLVPLDAGVDDGDADVGAPMVDSHALSMLIPDAPSARSALRYAGVPATCVGRYEKKFQKPG